MSLLTNISGSAINGTFRDGYQIWEILRGNIDTLNAKFYTGAGSPEGVVSAPVSSVYFRTDGSGGTVLYIKGSGAGNTGWIALDTLTGGSGDVVGPSSSVASEIVLFDGTTGKLVKRATGTGIVRVTSGVYGTPGNVVESEITLADNTTNNAATTKHGFLKKLSNVATEYMDGQGNWTDPVAAGSVSLAKLANLAAATVIGRGSSAGTGVPQALSFGAGMQVDGDVIKSVVTGSNGGDLVGPSSATDNAITRYDSTTGKLVQNSAITIDDSGVIGFPDGVKQTFNPDGTNAGLNVGSQAGDPSSLSNGDVWYNSSGNALKARINGATVSLGGGSSGALVLLEQHTASASASLDFTTWYSSTYDEYLIEAINLIPASNSTLQMALSTNGGSTWNNSSIYNWVGGYAYSGGAGAISGASATIFSFRDTTTTLLSNSSHNLSLRFMNPGSGANYKNLFGQVAFHDNTSGPLYIQWYGAWSSATAVDAFQFKMASGNLTSGVIRVYGVVKT